MDLKQIEKLIELMEKKGVTRLALRKKEFEIEIEKGHGKATCASTIHHPAPTHVEIPAESAKTETGTYITSPMVGTFYASPSPDDPPFARVGDSVNDDTVTCIVEAMKVMNEVKAGLSGKIIEVLVKNGDPVEFGTKIFRVET